MKVTINDKKNIDSKLNNSASANQRNIKIKVSSIYHKEIKVYEM